MLSTIPEITWGLVMIRSKRLPRTFVLGFLLASLLASACSPSTPAPVPTAMPPTPEPATPTPLPPKLNVPFTEPKPDEISPVVIQRTPEPGERLSPNGAIQLVFDRAMDQASVESALKLQPSVDGAVTWPDARTMTFKPAAALPLNATYDVALTQDAKAADGASLAQPYQFRVTTQGNLEVGQTIPADQAQDVDPSTIVTVLFNRPVVPITTLDQQASLPQPISFNPPIEGRAEWLNTSILVFRPTKPLPGGTTFEGRIAADLKDTEGNPLAAEYRWTFSTAAPKVIFVSPSDVQQGQQPGGPIPLPVFRQGALGQSSEQGARARVDTAITIRFNQPVDPASAQAAFSLTGARIGAMPIAGTFEVMTDTLVFTPTERLRFDDRYVVRVAAGVMSASGGVPSRQPFESAFTTVPLPRIVETMPKDGERNADSYASFVIRFNTEVDPATVMPRLSVTPALSPTQVFTFYNSYDASFILNFGPQPATEYEFRIEPGIADPYGNRIEEPLTVRFRTRDADPSVTLALPYNGATLNAYLPARLVASTINVSQLDLELYELPSDGVAFQPQYIYDRDAAVPGQTLVRKWSQPIAGERNRQARTAIDLAEGGGLLKPSLYMLVVTSPDIPKDRYFQRSLLAVSEVNLLLKTEPAREFVWATDLKTGLPVNDLTLDFYRLEYGTGQSRIVPTGSSTTDANGVAQVNRTAEFNSSVGYGSSFAIARATRSVLPKVSQDEGRFAAVSSEWGNGIRPYDLGIGFPIDYNTNTPLRAFIYTDRPIYRPGQKAFVRGLVRAQDDFNYSLPPPGTNAQINVRDITGQQVFSQALPLDEYGAFNFEVTLAEGAALGAYQIEAIFERQDDPSRGDVPQGNAYASFTVAAYRPPEYEVTVTPGATETVRGTSLRGSATPTGSGITATVNAKYLSGGGLQNAKVQWNALARPTFFDPPQLDQYTFSDNDDPWLCLDCWWFPRSEPPQQPLLSGEGATNERGEFEITIPISTELRAERPFGNAFGQPITGPVSLSIEANVSGADNQIIAGRASVTAHPADYYLGIAMSENVLRSTKPVTIELVAVDWQGARLSDKAIEVAVYRRDWKSRFVRNVPVGPTEFGGTWDSEVNDELITTTQTTSAAQGEARVTFTPPQAGTYKIVARGRDNAGRPVQSSRFAWATGPEFVPWLRENNDKINLIANKSSFAPGETAEILIPSPFIDEQTVEHLALVTIERGHVLQYEVVRITSSSQTYRLPITSDFAPNVFVSVALFKGMQLLSSGDGGTSPREGGDGGRPDQKLGYVGLKVEPVKQVFNITLTPDRALTQPGESVTYAIRATDSDGQPVRAQFSLDLVDKGILNLLPRAADEIVQAFYGLAGLRIQTASGLSVSANRITDEQLKQSEAANKGLGYGGAAATTAPAATEASAASAPPAAGRAMDQAAAAAPAQPVALNALQVRENFADTAYWSPAITTDANGQASVTIKLPDNLTTWVLRSVGIDLTTRVGENTVDVVATKPLLIRPVTPRFLVINDVVELGAIVNNNTDASQTARVKLEASGVTISTTTLVEQEITIPAGGEAKVTWLAQATDATQADLVFSVANDQYSDASKPRLSTAPNGGLKINRYIAPEVVGTAGQLEGESSRVEIIALPPNLDTTQGQLIVRLDPSLAAPMQDALTYLKDYPYDSTEGVVSRFLPNVLTYRALKELGIDNPTLAEKLPELVRSSLQKLYALQHEDGGWGWWRDDESNPNVSAYAVSGMIRARAAGFDVSNDSLERGLGYLQAQTQALDERSASMALDWQTYLQYVLGEAGRNDPARLDNLFNLRANLSNYARALLIMVIGKRDANDARLKTLFADLNAQVIQSATGAHWEERTIDWWAMNTNVRTTAMVLDAMALYDAENNLAPVVVRWLMMARKGGTPYWSSSQETVWALIALTDWMRATDELKANYPYAALLNDKPIAEGVFSRATITQSAVVNTPIADLLRDVGNKLNIARGPGEGRLYYSAYLQAYLPVPSVKAADRGITVLRRYTLASCNDGAQCRTVTRVKVGETVRVALTLIAPSDLYYVQVEDPLPAGAEAIDLNLATTSQLAAGPSLSRNDASGTRGYWWWRWYSRSELRDDRVVLFASYLPKGTYEYSYTMRATSPGQFNVIPTFANQQYLPEVFGRSDGALFTVER